MGVASSKIGQEDNEEVTAGSVPSTPILTPKHKKPVENILDPRSPSFNIIRTPITSCSTPFTPEANACDTFNINSPALIKAIEDPRSPTLAFTRTPITAVEDTNLLRKIHKKNLDRIKKVIAAKPSQVPPKLLESSPIKPKPFDNRRKSFVGLLETNLDYVETDLDAVIMSKSSPASVKYISPNNKRELKAKFLQNSQDEKECTQDICDIDSVNQELILETKEEEDLHKTFDNVLQLCDKVGDIEVCDILQGVIDDDGLIIEAPVLFAGAAAQTITEVATFDKLPELLEPVSEVVASSEIVEVTPKKLIETTTVEEFEKKVNKLIYTEQDHIIESPKVKAEAANRTPLRARNGNNANMTKSKPRLRVSDKPRRSDYTTSRIPVFKTKTGQCENTPPRKHLQSGRKSRRAQWDSDNTLII